MRPRPHIHTLITMLCMALGCSVPAHGEERNTRGEHLKFVLVLSRHGVRSPTWTNERLDEYSKVAWPKWEVAPGLLTPHGKKLMTELGSYYRQSFASRGLVEAEGCADADRLYIYTDSDQRTMETGHGLANGLFPGCAVVIHSRDQDQQDPLFHTAAKPGGPSAQLAYAALAGRIGDRPAALSTAYQDQLKQMQQLLLACDDQTCKVDGKRNLLQVSTALASGKDDHLVDMKGPLSTASTFAENLQLEYLQGMAGAQLGWGHADEAEIRSLMIIHSAVSDLVQRTPYLARAQASNLAAHILATLQQAVAAHAIRGAIGGPENKIVFLVGHDTNIANLAALLDAHWLVDGYQRDDAAPGGALVFELWSNDAGADELRTHYVVETPSQMRDETALSLASPPAKATIFLPGCSHAGEGYPCVWPAFRHLLASMIEHDVR